MTACTVHVGMVARIRGVTTLLDRPFTAVAPNLFWQGRPLHCTVQSCSMADAGAALLQHCAAAAGGHRYKGRQVRYEVVLLCGLCYMLLLQPGLHNASMVGTVCLPVRSERILLFETSILVKLHVHCCTMRLSSPHVFSHLCCKPLPF
jgi:hypothetical protein